MSTPTTQSGATTQNPAPSNNANQPQSTSNKANNRKLKNSIAYTSKLRSSGPLRNDTDTERIRLRLASGGSAADLAEEGYRLCNMNAKLRSELAEAKREVHAPLLTDDDTARIRNRLDNGDTAQEIAVEAYRVCRINVHLKKTAKSTHGDMREMRKKMAVKEDALSEMRSEYPEARELLQRTWGLLKSQNIKIPHDLRQAYEDLTTPDGHDWQRYKGGRRDVRLTKEQAGPRKKKNKTEAQKKKELAKDQVNGKVKEQVKGKGKAKEDEGKPEPTSFALHTDTVKTYDLGKPLADKDSEAEDSDDPDVAVSKSEPPATKKSRAEGSDADDSDASVSKPGPSGSKKRKGGHMEGPVAKKSKNHDVDTDEEVEVGIKEEVKRVIQKRGEERDQASEGGVKEKRRKFIDVVSDDEPGGLSSELSDLSDLEEGEIQE